MLNGNMAYSMHRWGAIDTECPVCHKFTPIYTTAAKGGNKSVGCLYCGISLQWDNVRAVVAEIGLLSEEEQQSLDKSELVIWETQCLAEARISGWEVIPWWKKLVLLVLRNLSEWIENIR